MDYIINGTSNDKLFHFFEEISNIPRSSGNEKAISDYLVAFAQERNLSVSQDKLFNVVIKKDSGTTKPPVILQGHIDMVCEKTGSVPHNFDTEGLKLKIIGGKITADGTTLGADNGIAVAIMLTLLDNTDKAFPPLECVFTAQEETGLSGAEFLDKSQLNGRVMINMDSEDEGVATISSAGGMRIDLSRKCITEKCKGNLITFNVSGLSGGHSGMDIDKGRANANLLMGLF